VGGHRVDAQKAGYLRAGQDISVLKMEEMITINLKPGGNLKIKSDPSEARIEINNRPIGSTPLEHLVPPGGYSLKILKDEYEVFQTNVEIRAGDEKVVEAKLKPNFGFVDIYATPTGARVSLNGKIIGSSPLKQKVSLGKHQIDIRYDNRYDPYTEDIEIYQGETKNMYIKLKYSSEYLLSLQNKRKTANIVSLSGLGLAVVGTGIVVLFTLRADSAYDDYKGATIQADIDNYRDNEKFNRDISYIGWGALGAGIATAVIALIARPEIPKNIGLVPDMNQSEGRNGVYVRRAEEGKLSPFVFPGGLGMDWRF